MTSPPPSLFAALPPAPHNEEAEQALLGALLVNNKAFGMVGGFLRPEHFYDPVHQRIYAAIADQIEAGRQVTPVTLKAYFEHDPDLPGEGAAYLAELAANVVTVINAAEYGRIIHDTFVRRQVIEVAAGAMGAAYAADIDLDAAGIIARTEADLAALAEFGRAASAKGPASLDMALDEAAEVIARAQSAPDGVSGVPTGLIDLDRRTSGMQRGELIIVAGRPSMGKTALALNIAENAAERGYQGLLDSLEMTRPALAQRLIARRSGVPVPDQRRPMTGDQTAAVERARQALKGLRLSIDDDGAVTASQVRARARAFHRRRGLDFLIIDYLGLIKADDDRKQKVHQIEDATRILKATAKELDIPVVLLVQLSRAVEQREDKRPQLADLRDSGAIEQDADVVMFVFREQYYLERAEPQRRADEAQTKFNDRYEAWERRLEEVRNTAEVIIAKQRQGEVGTVRLYFDGARQEFADLENRGAAP